MAEEEGVPVKMLCGVCPDSHCGKLLYFISPVNSEVECSNCGQKHSPSSLLNVQESSDPNIAVGSLLKSILFSNTATKKGAELVKVRGLSNFHCKLISPLLTKYGMDKKTGKAKLLSELGQPEVFNCSVFGNRAFLIEKEHLDTPGYGRDNTGSLGYLKDTLGMITNENSDNCLVPLHSDGDGHCLVHAISRGVVGRELLWHSLRQNLKDHLVEDNMKYQGLFRDFIDINEWDEIIAEADPNYHPETNEPFGLRNIHVFGLANVLHRPIILLDSLEGMQSCGDYSGLFLPVLAPLDQCKPQGVLNKPLAIAWSSSARNHYVPLVGIKDSPLPKIPRTLLPKAWGIPNEVVSTYIEFDENGCCAIGGSRSLPDSYVQRLVSAMDDVFFQEHEVCPELVADVNQFVFKPSNAVGISIPEIIEFTQKAVESESLFRCLSCQAIKEVKDVLPRSWREPGGKWYTRVQEKGPLADAVFQFDEAKGVRFMYEVKYDMLMPVIMNQDMACDLCQGVIREVTASGSVRYMNGDRTMTKSTNNMGCTCGFKHFWSGKEYDNFPKIIDVSLAWNGHKIEEQVFWFDRESDPSLNSNVYELATGVVQKHFPGEFGSETLVRKIVDKILRETELKKSEDEAPTLRSAIEFQPMETEESQQTTPTTPDKIILIGPKKKTLHKEELTMNEEEKLTKARTSHRAAYSQKRKSSKESPEKQSGSTKHGKQEMQKLSKDKPEAENTASATKPVASTKATSRPAKPRDLKIRLTSSDGRTSTVTLKPSSTYANLQDVIETELGIPKDRQKIRYGFPPQELKPPEEENAVLPLTPGVRVSVEELPELKPKEELLPNNTGTESMDVEAEGASTVEKKNALASEELEDSDPGKLASNLLSMLQGALNVDRWETWQHQPELFARGGTIYDQVVAKAGALQDDMHCAIGGLPGKIFAYNEKEDRFEICLGQKHIPVQPLDEDTLSRAHARTGDMAPMRRPVSRDDQEGLGAFSGVVRHRNASEGRAAFSGTGRTLGGSVKTGAEEKKEELLSPMKVDDPNDSIALVQITTDDPRSLGTTVDKSGNKDREGTTMDTQSGEEVTNPSVPSDIEMPEVKSDQDLGHDVGKNEHETSTNAHETSLTQHGASSFEPKTSKVEPVVSNEGNEIDDGGHGLINAEHGVSAVENEVDQAKHETLNDAHASF